jgi:uncharacterized repeat protein (TIGR03803 family)
MKGKRLSTAWPGILAIFSLTLFATGIASGKEKVLHSFGRDGDGAYPFGSVIMDAAGNLYGTATCTTYDYSCLGDGFVFELTPGEGGEWSEKVLHQFSGRDGSNPEAGLIFDIAGNLYGSTVSGGAYRRGTVFELSPNQDGSWTETVLHSFGNGSDGRGPGNLIWDAAGNLYGVTGGGGSKGNGTAFELTPIGGGDWSEKVLHNFHGTLGRGPTGSLTWDAAGNLYGATGSGGIYDLGAVFEMTPTEDGNWSEKVLHSFGHPTDGFNPSGSLIFDAAGNLYGTTSGDFDYYVTVFEFTP